MEIKKKKKVPWKQLPCSGDWYCTVVTMETALMEASSGLLLTWWFVSCYQGNEKWQWCWNCCHGYRRVSREDSVSESTHSLNLFLSSSKRSGRRKHERLNGVKIVLFIESVWGRMTLSLVSNFVLFYFPLLTLPYLSHVVFPKPMS